MTTAKVIWQIGPGLLGLLLLLLVLGQPAQGQEQAVIEDLDVVALPGDRVQLRFQMSQPVAAPRNFTINEPARIVLDFPATTSALAQRRTVINTGVAESLTVLEAGDRARATLNLARMVPFSLRSEGSSVLLTLDAGSAGATAALENATTAAARLAPSQVAADTGPAADNIQGIDFRRGPEGQGIVVISLADPNVAVDVREQGERIVADFRNSRLPRGQERRLDVTDFGTPVNLVDALNQNGTARISIQPSGRYEYLAYQTGNLYTIEVIPVQEEQAAERARQTFSGEPLSLNFQDIEVRAVLQIIADFTGLNVVVSDSVQGNLTLRLQNVPWDQALDIILRTKGLSLRQNGNVIYVAPTEEITAREQLELQAQQQRVQLEPLRTELIQVNYAKADTLASLLKTGENNLLSERGSVTVDARTNNLLISDVPGKISELRELVTRLDVPVRQVLIDSRVVIARDDFSRELGVRFGGAGVAPYGEQGFVGITGSSVGAETMLDDALINSRVTGTPFPVFPPALNESRTGVRLGTTSDPFGRLAMVILSQDYLLDLELSALQAEGRGETLSNPRVITTDRNQAFIKQGREIPYQVVSDDGVNIQFKEAKLELIVTPQITPDNRVLMDLRINKNEQGQNVSTGTGGSVPSIDTREIETQVLINNGETIVLGGVFEQVTGDDVDKIPFLSDIPGLGKLFQRTAKTNSKLELLIFVTPQIITEDLGVR